MIRIYEYGQVPAGEIFARVEPKVDVESVVAEILENVRTRGDRAVLEYCEKFDKAKLDSLQVSQQELDAAMDAVDPKLLKILEKAAANIRRFHEKQVRNSFVITDDGVVMGQRIIPVDRAGLYVPGGTAAYPSTVLMDSIPAKLAGCPQVVMVTPPALTERSAP